MARVYEEQLKSALAAADFTAAQQLIAAYSDEIVQLLSAPSAVEQQQQAIASFHDLLSLARVMRAHLATRLTALERQSCYRYEVPSSDNHAWRFEA